MLYCVLLGHRLPHSDSKQGRGFLLLLGGDMWWKELRQTSKVKQRLNYKQG